ncbi:MAG: DEAD/DEAH box helicase family protein, partial [Ottowia sp.]|nr:DEAD/DEAH box helicase family protein [Ottowia sp.]
MENALTPQSLIINSPYAPPTHHWERASGGKLNPQPVAGRRPAGYEIFDTRNNTVRSVELALVNTIRGLVDKWRADEYPGVTNITRLLLEHWRSDDVARQYPFYFCQLEAIETLMWHVEAPAEYKSGISIVGDGGAWERLCCKMATGSGKTTVMAMIVAWQVLNALAHPQRSNDFSRAILVVTPGLTVKERLQVLRPGHADNYYDAFSICPNAALRERLNSAEIVIENWHSLMPLEEPKHSVVKKGAESDEAFVRRVLGPMAQHRDILVLNDEAHHAYRKPAEAKISKKDAELHGIDLEAATRWIEGLDRIHGVRRIVRCFDLSATPFAPTGKTSTEQALFSWVVSDFGLNDAIEAGLVKTPRVVVRDDALPASTPDAQARQYRSKLYHIYREQDVADDLNHKGAEPHDPLPQLVQTAYTLLGADWRETRRAWEAAGHVSPPVLLTVCNRTETAARIEHYLNHDAHWDEMKVPQRTLRVDSSVLQKAEMGEKASADKGYEAQLRAIVDEVADMPPARREALQGATKEELLRAIVDSVGKRGGAGERVQSVVSVAMLSEGWDAKNVTHIMGLRAFTSQLLCEQVIGRGLRRVSYETEMVRCPDGVERALLRPEFVNVFGVPLSIVQEGEGGTPPPPPPPSTQIEVRPERAAFEITWPNVLRVERELRAQLVVDWARVPPLAIDPAQLQIAAELAPALGGATNLAQAVEIDLEKLPEQFRAQRLLFQAAHKALLAMRHDWRGSIGALVPQLVRLVEYFTASRELLHIPSQYHNEPLRRRILTALCMDTIVQHLVAHIRQQNVQQLQIVLDTDFPTGATGRMRTWYSTKPCMATEKSHVSHAVADSSWEDYTAKWLDKSANVQAWVKNDHLGFQVYYLWRGSQRRFVPDFIIRLANGKRLALEIKGLD